MLGDQGLQGGRHVKRCHPVLRLARLPVDEFKRRETIPRVLPLKVLRGQIDDHLAGDPAGHARHPQANLGASQRSLVSVDRIAEEVAKSLRGTRAQRRHVRNVLHAAAREVRHHRAPRLVVPVVLVDRRHPEQHGGKERQAGHEKADGRMAGEHDTHHQGTEDDHERQEQRRALRL